MILTDQNITDRLHFGDLVIDPVRPDQIQPASVDLRLDNKLMSISALTTEVNPALDRIIYDHFEVGEGESFVMERGGFVLASTVEYVEFPNNLAGQVIDKSSLARLGLGLHAGFIDPGFKGHITLEITNHSGRPFHLWPGMLIGQLAIMRMSGSVHTAYGKYTGAHYQTQPRGPVPYKGFDRFRHGLPEGYR